MVLVLVN